MIAYNINSVPNGMTLEEVLEIFYTTNLLIYDGDDKPYHIDKENLDHDIAIINPRRDENVTKI